MGNLLGLDLLTNPDLAANPAVAAKILAYGMEHGSFTGKALDDYINDSGTDYLNARRIINGLDQKNLIAGYAENFDKHLEDCIVTIDIAFVIDTTGRRGVAIFAKACFGHPSPSKRQKSRDR